MADEAEVAEVMEGEAETEEEDEQVAEPVVVVPSTLAEGWDKGYYVTPELLDVEGGTSASTSTYNTLPLLRCVNTEAVWRLSGAKPGNGIECLLDGNLDTFWQSDGAAPHAVFIQFYKRTTVAEIALYVDYRLDESYTPKRITLRAGTTHHDLEEIRTLEVEEPKGWVRIPVGNPNGKGLQRHIRTWYLQIVISTMHQSGRDTHIRCIKILAPPAAGSNAAGTVMTSSFGGGASAAATTTTTNINNNNNNNIAAPLGSALRFAPPSFATFLGGSEVR